MYQCVLNFPARICYMQVEAATGKGILGQLISYLKFLGLLGPASGF